MNHLRLLLTLILIGTTGMSNADNPFNKWMEWTERNQILDRDATAKTLNTLLPTSPNQHPLELTVKTKAKAALSSLLLPAKSASHHDLDYVAKTRADMHGALPEIMEELIAHLKDPKKYPCEKAVMFYGPPGTGKTLGAQVVAGEAGAIFYHASGAEAINKYVGVGADYLRNLFADAEREVKNGNPVVVFLDEVDSLCRSRNDENMNGESLQTLLQFLSNISHIQDNYKCQPIILLTATNHKDNIDPAAIRQGRLFPVEIGMPDKASRRSILEKKALNAGVNIPEKLLDSLANKTNDFNNAELENIIFVAQKRAHKNGKDAFSASDINAIFPNELKKQRERLKHDQEQERRKKAREYMLDENLKSAEIQHWQHLILYGSTVIALGKTIYEQTGPLIIAGGSYIMKTLEDISKK